jgi:hypothetical protein
MKPLFKQLLTVAVLAIVPTLAQAQNQSAPKDASVISGTISADNQPLTNARVMIGKVNSNTVAQMLPVDSNGSFHTGLLDPGLYFVSASAGGLIGDPSATTRAYYRPGDTVNIKMVKGGVITGSVKNANGDALIAVPVRAIMTRNRNGDSLQFASTFRESITDDRGLYRLYGLPPGTYIVSAGGPSGRYGVYMPTAYEGFAPTYSPSATRDTATQIELHSGDEAQADVQYREERGHVISGTITGAPTSDGPQVFGASVILYDVRNHFEAATGTAISASNFSFALSGIPDGDYELSANQASSPNEQLASPSIKITVQGADVTGLRLTVAPLASLEGRVSFEPDPKAPCGKPRAETIAETMISSRRFEPQTRTKEASASDVPLVYRITARSAALDSKGAFTMKNMHPGNYQIDTSAITGGWYLRSVALERTGAAPNLARDGISLKRGEHVTGLVITLTEGGANLTGRITAPEGQPVPLKLRGYLVPSEREAAGNLYRFYESVVETSGQVKFENVAPGKYWIVARRTEDSESGLPKLIRQDEALRTKVRQEAETLNKPVTLKPCEQVKDFDLPSPP